VNASAWYIHSLCSVDDMSIFVTYAWLLHHLINFHVFEDNFMMFSFPPLQYPLYTLLAFDSRQHALPVAWVITRTITKQDVCKWMKALADRVRAVDSAWRINGFIIDDPALEIDPIRYETIYYFILCFVSFNNQFDGVVGKYFAAPFSSVCGVFEDHGLGISSRNAITLQSSANYSNV